MLPSHEGLAIECRHNFHTPSRTHRRGYIVIDVWEVLETTKQDRWDFGATTSMWCREKIITDVNMYMEPHERVCINQGSEFESVRALVNRSFNFLTSCSRLSQLFGRRSGNRRSVLLRFGSCLQATANSPGTQLRGGNPTSVTPTLAPTRSPFSKRLRGVGIDKN